VKIEFLPHTADVEMRVEGSSMEELFVAAIRGMAQVLREGGCSIRDTYPITLRIEIQAPDLTCLLIDTLSDILALSFINKAVFCEAHFTELTQNHLAAGISGYEVDGFDEEIKAVTYHGADVIQSAGSSWETRVIFDI